MNQQPIKITYIPAQFRVRVEFTKAQCLASDAPPPDLMERAKAKLRQEKKRGNVAFYRIFKTRLERLWQTMRHADVPADAKVALTLVTGAPPLPGILINHPLDDGSVARLSFEAPPDVLATWRLELVKLTIGKLIRELKITAIPDPAQIHAAWLRACRGEMIRGLSLLPVPPVQPERASTQPYEIRTGADGDEIVVVIHDVKKLAPADAQQALLQAIDVATSHLAKQTGQEYFTLEKQVIRAIASANRGPEAFGIDLPLVVLGAFPNAPVRKYLPVQSIGTTAQTLGPSVVKTRPAAKDKPLSDYVRVVVGPDAMEAKVGAFDMSYYKSGSNLDIKSWQQLLKAAAVVNGLAPNLLEDLAAKLAEKQDLTGLRLASGSLGTPGKSPFLEESYKLSPRPTGSTDVINMRDLQQRHVVKKGQLIAQVAYRTPASAGRDVHGAERPPLSGEGLAVTIGEGVTVKDGCMFYAAADGKPEINGLAIALTRVLIFEGNVNLSSGNIRFDGPVEINGSIEQGSRVEVHGDLHVHGMIQGGVVIAKGNIKVDGGIATNSDAKIHAGKDIAADFIENATVYCGGSLAVVKSIISSYVTAGENISVTEPPGQVIGGEITCGHVLTCTNLGRASGTVTKVKVGNNPRWEQSVAVRQKRLVRLTEVLRADRASLRDLNGRTKAQLNHRHDDLKKILQLRVAHLAKIIEKLTVHVQSAKSQVTFREGAQIRVTNVLSANCTLEVCGRRVAVMQEIAAVAVVAKAVNGTCLVPLVEDSPSPGNSFDTPKAS